MKKLLLSLCLCALLISGCVGVTPIAETPPSAVAPTPTELSVPEVEPIHPDLEIISPENVERLEEIGKWGESIAYDIAIAPDRKTIAAATVDGIHFYDSQTLEEVNQIESKSDYTANLHYSISYSPDGKYLASSGNYGVSIINLSTGEREKRIYSQLPGNLGDTYITDVEISPDNHYAVVTSETISIYCDARGRNFALYDITGEHGKLLFDRYVCWPDMSRFRFTSDNRIYFFLWFATVPYPYQMDVVDLGTGGLIESVSFDYRMHDPLNAFYDISPDGKVFASADDKNYIETTRLIDVDTGNVLQTIEGSYIAFTSKQDGSYTWHEMKKTPLSPSVPSCAVPPNGMQYEEIFSENDTITLLVKNELFSSIELWDMSKCKLLKHISFTQDYSGMGEFTSDGTLFAMPSGSDLKIWDVKTNQLRFVVHNHSFRFPINSFAFNENGTLLAISSMESYGDKPPAAYFLDIWDTQTGRLLSTNSIEGEYLYDLVPSPNPDVIAIVAHDTIKFWNIESGNKISTFPAGNFAINSDGDSVWMLFRGGHSITLFDLKTKKPIKSVSLSRATEVVYGFYVDKKGGNCAVLYTNGDTTYLEKINLQTGKEIFQTQLDNRTYSLIDQKDYILTYETNNVDIWNFQSNLPVQSIYGVSGRNLAISPDNRILVSDTDQRTKLGIWDIQSGKLRTEISTPFEITNAQFSPDGQLIVLGGTDGFIHVWGVRKP